MSKYIKPPGWKQVLSLAWEGRTSISTLAAHTVDFPAVIKGEREREQVTDSWKSGFLYQLNVISDLFLISETMFCMHSRHGVFQSFPRDGTNGVALDHQEPSQFLLPAREDFRSLSWVNTLRCWSAETLRGLTSIRCSERLNSLQRQPMEQTRQFVCEDLTAQEWIPSFSLFSIVEKNLRWSWLNVGIEPAKSPGSVSSDSHLKLATSPEPSVDFMFVYVK